MSGLSSACVGESVHFKSRADSMADLVRRISPLKKCRVWASSPFGKSDGQSGGKSARLSTSDRRLRVYAALEILKAMIGFRGAIRS